MDKDHSTIEQSLALVSENNLYWARPALIYLEAVQPYAAMKFTIHHLKKEFDASNSPAKQDLSPWLNRLENITQQNQSQAVKMFDEISYYTWFYLQQHTLWHRIISHAYTAEFSFRDGNQGNCAIHQALALYFVNEEEHQASKDDKFRVIELMAEYGDSLSTTLNT